MNPESEIIEDWLNRARDDEKSSQIILEEAGPPNTVCFLAQQMAEKLLKAYLTSKENSTPKLHDLIKLLELCAHHDSQLENLKQDAALLNQFYIETRYPGDYPEFTSTEAQEAFQSAINIKNEILSVTQKTK